MAHVSQGFLESLTYDYNKIAPTSPVPRKPSPRKARRRPVRPRPCTKPVEVRRWEKFENQHILTKTGLLQPSSWLKSVIIINHSHEGWNCVFLLHKSLPLCFIYTQFSLLVPVPGVLEATLGEYCTFDHEHSDLT